MRAIPSQQYWCDIRVSRVGPLSFLESCVVMRSLRFAPNSRPFLGPFSIQKKCPEPQICSNFVPTIAFRGANQGDPNLSKSCLKMIVSRQLFGIRLICCQHCGKKSHFPQYSENGPPKSVPNLVHFLHFCSPQIFLISPKRAQKKQFFF